MVATALAATLVMGAGIDCPQGSESAGAPWPASQHGWCEREGVLHGPVVVWHDNGRIKVEGQFADDKKSGVWTYGYDNGRRRATGSFEDGIADGVWSWWHENGRLAEEGVLEKGVEQGMWKAWHENGRLAEEGEFVTGARVGWWIQWDEDGREVQRVRYEDNEVAEIERARDTCTGFGCHPSLRGGVRIYEPLYRDPFFYTPFYWRRPYSLYHPYLDYSYPYHPFYRTHPGYVPRHHHRPYYRGTKRPRSKPPPTRVTPTKPTGKNAKPSSARTRVKSRQR